VVWNEIRVLSQAIAGAFDLNDAGVVEESIEQRGRDDGVSEDLAPFGEAAIGSQE
jgi:hypothetical protein